MTHAPVPSAGPHKQTPINLDLEHDMEVIGEAANGHQAVDMVIKLSPSDVVMEITMPLLNATGSKPPGQSCSPLPPR